MVVEDLIQNAEILFGERPLHSSHVPSPRMTETAPSSLSVGSTTAHLSGIVGDTPMSTQFSSSISQSDSLVDVRLPRTLGLSSSQSRMETTMQEQDASETLPTLSTQPEDAPPSVEDSQWLVPDPGLYQYPEEQTDPPSPPESMRSSTTDFSLSSASLVSSPNGSPPSHTASL